MGCRRRCRAASFSLLALFALRALALELALNGARIRSISSAELSSLAGPVALPAQAARGAAAAGEASLVRGVSLGELYPLVAEAWRLEAKSASASRAWEDEGLGERLFELYLVEAPGGTWELRVGGERLGAAERLDLAAEVLAEDGAEFWVSWEGVAELKAEVARFAKAHGRSIKTVEVPNTQSKLVAVARGGGKLPDLVMIQSDYAPGLARMGLLQSVEYLRSPDLVDKGFEAFRSEGRYWALPFYFDAQLVFYRGSIAGPAPRPDWSLEELEARARALKGKVEHPLAWNLYSAYWLLPFAAGYGKAGILDPAGGMRADDEATARALDQLLKLRDEGLLEPAERDAMISWFASGKAAYILSGSYSIPEFERVGLDFGVAPYPVVAATGKPVAPMLDFKGLALSRRTARPILARRLAQYLTSAPVQARFTSSQSKLPASKAAWELSRGSNRYFEALSRSYEIGLVVPPSEAYAAYKNVMWKILRLVVTGQMRVREALATAQRLVDENLAE
ncbi:MAG TPA: extracellular solute-binding protein [Spirochaetales bacterium]|nr:extracellular solute-binding protein [Spirochaetales bacterium]HRY54786.1 extracellular solute-binding protein [Spirochaetia bacterium]